jgi:hypothetical protein
MCAEEHRPLHRRAYEGKTRVKHLAFTAKSAKPSHRPLDATATLVERMSTNPSTKTLSDIYDKGKRVLVSVDFNVPQDKKIPNNQRIAAAIPSVRPTMRKVWKEPPASDSSITTTAAKPSHRQLNSLRIAARSMKDEKLLELLQAAITSGHVVLVGADDTWKESCPLPGQQERLSCVTAAVAQQKAALVACAGCMTISGAHLSMFCLAVVEIIIVMCGYACLAAYLRY